MSSDDSTRGEINLALPGNPRYQPRALQDIFGYDNLYRGVGEVELATFDVLGEIGVIPDDQARAIDGVRERILDIYTTEVDRIERKVTGHDIRAWVKEAQRILREAGKGTVGRWIHVPLTSYDPINTGSMILFRRAHEQVLIPSFKELLPVFATLIENFAGTVQIGRTHGQHALPITVGFWLATVVSRILYNIEKMCECAEQLTGKISGAVGASNAIVGLGIESKCGRTSFEERVLAKLGLKPARISTQILPPEPLAYYLHACCLLTAAFAQLGHDGRNLMRSEIAEVREAFGKTQVGSSTMPFKRNPVRFEGLVGGWLKTMAEFLKVHLCMTSEHQRDLTGSSVARDFPTIIVNLATQLNILLRKNDDGVSFLGRIQVDKEACARTIEGSAANAMGEPIYIALQMAGYEDDAHYLVNHTLVPKSAGNGQTLMENLVVLAGEDEDVHRAYSAIPPDVVSMLNDPTGYTGNAELKAREIAALARTKANEL